MDITNRGGLAEVIRRAEGDVGPVDICVNNAGLIYTLGQLKDMDDAAWDLNLQVNLTGTYNVTKAVFPGMRERKWGRVISMASIAGLMGGFGQTAYATSKMGVVGFAKSVALEGARYNITSNVIAPGIIGPNANLSPMYERMVKRVAMQTRGPAGGRGQCHRLPLLGARALHHGVRPHRHRGDGPLHVLADIEPTPQGRIVMPTVKETFDAMASRFQPSKAAGVNATIQYDITGDQAGTWHAVIKDGACAVNQGAAPSPNLTLSMSSQDWLDMVGGKLSGQMAFMSGKLKLKGDMGLAMKVGSLFSV